MLRRITSLGAALLLSSALAAPFVFQDRWSAQPNGQAGGTLAVGRVGDLTSFNPFMNDGGLYQALTVTSGGLMMLDPTTLKWVPYQAESYTVSPDRQTWTFQIRRGMKWSDGQPITAKDFETSCVISTDMSMMSTAGHNHFMFPEGHMRCEATAPYTLRVTLPAQMADAEIILAYLKAQPDHIFGKAYRKNPRSILSLWPLTMNPKELVVDGPFTLDRYERGKVMWLKRNPYFGQWNVNQQGKPLPYLARVKTLIFPESADTRADAMARGELDTLLLEDLGPLNLMKTSPLTKKGDIRLFLNTGPAYRLERFALNWWVADPVKRQLFRDVRFRRALSYLTDRTRMAQAIGGGQTMHTDVLPVYPNLIAKDAAQYPYDPKKAAALLTDMGLKRNAEGKWITAKGQPVAFSISYNASNQVRHKILEVFAASARQSGLSVSLMAMPTPAWEYMMFGNTLGPDKVMNREYDAVEYDLGGESMFYPFDAATHTCEGLLWMHNRSGTCLQPWEQQVSTLFEKGNHEVNVAKRLQVTRQIQRIIAEQQPWNLMISPAWNYAVSSRVRGYYPEKVMNGLLSVGDLTLMWMPK